MFVCRNDSFYYRETDDDYCADVVDVVNGGGYYECILVNSINYVAYYIIIAYLIHNMY